MKDMIIRRAVVCQDVLERPRGKIDKGIRFVVGDGFVEIDDSQAKSNQDHDPEDDKNGLRILGWQEEMFEKPPKGTRLKSILLQNRRPCGFKPSHGNAALMEQAWRTNPVQLFHRLVQRPEGCWEYTGCNLNLRDDLPKLICEKYP